MLFNLFYYVVVWKVLYLDAFVHDVPISRCPVRANAWDTNLMNKVIKKDLISPSMFRKLQLKEQLRSTKKTPLLGGLLQSEAFVSSKLPQSFFIIF
ncbi:hypothetical protein ZWY2020_014394 [Hordeum vulgare]|nr:hypothetical protein ZWY2020_014394 [Hordeum vulgare]